MEFNKKLVIDLDHTLTKGDNNNYKYVSPNNEIIAKLKQYKKDGFYICIYTARNMRKYSGDMKKINSFTLPIILNWLKKYDVPFDEVVVGKPWCGYSGFYVDDKAIRPSEFLKFSYSQIKRLINI